MNSSTRYKLGSETIRPLSKPEARALRRLGMRFLNWFYVAERLFGQRRVLATHLRDSLREGRERLSLIKELTTQLEKLNAAYELRVAERDALRAQLSKRPARAARRSVKIRV